MFDTREAESEELFDGVLNMDRGCMVVLSKELFDVVILLKKELIEGFELVVLKICNEVVFITCDSFKFVLLYKFSPPPNATSLWFSL